MRIESKKDLRAVYGFPSGRAKEKVLGSLEKHSKHFIACSPFIVLSTVNSQNKMDASPRGGQSGFVNILNDTELIIPDFKGNNRIDSLTNIIETKTIGLLFMIPGIDETLRINGSAMIETSEKYIDLFKEEAKIPITCIKVTIDELFLHCAKAFMRSKLWDVATHTSPNAFPTMGVMLKDQLDSPQVAESRDQMIERYTKDI